MERDFFKEPLSRDEIVSLLGSQSARAARDLFSFRSPTFKATGLEADALTDDQLIDLMAQEPRYLRRPVAVIEGRLIPSANERTLAAELGTA